MILLTDGHTLKVSECYEWAERARQAGVKLTTMGIGTEFNEDLLIPLADATGGSAYYVETAAQIPQAFRKELGAVQRITYRNLEVKLQLSQVELRRVYRVLPELSLFDPGPDMEGSYSLLLGDYDPGAPVTLLLEVVVPPWSAGVHRLAQVLFTWEDPTLPLERQNLRQEIVDRDRPEGAAGGLDGRVMNIVEKVGAYKMGAFALDRAQSAALTGDPQDKQAATMQLRQAATRLLDLGENGLASSMQKQADTLEITGSLDVEVTKKLRYDSRKISRPSD